MGQLDIGRIAREGRDRVPGPFHQRRIVGEAVQRGCLGRLMRRQQRLEAEGLRRLDADELVARRRLGDMAAASMRLTVSVTGQAGMAAPWPHAELRSRARSGPARRRGGRRHGPARYRRSRRGQREQAAPDRGLPGCAADVGGASSRGLEPADRIGIACLVAVSDHDLDRGSIAGSARNGRERLGEDGGAISSDTASACRHRHAGRGPPRRSARRRRGRSVNSVGTASGPVRGR